MITFKAKWTKPLLIENAKKVENNGGMPLLETKSLVETSEKSLIEVTRITNWTNKNTIDIILEQNQNYWTTPIMQIRFLYYDQTIVEWTKDRKKSNR